MQDATRTLSDRIRLGIRVLFVGINPGLRSAATGHHFAGYSNRFWKLLYESGLVPERIAFEDDVRLPEWGYGITNLVPRASAGIGDLRPEEYEAGRGALIRKVRRYRPSIVALVGVTLYRALFGGRPEASRRRGATEGTPAAVRREGGLERRPTRLGLQQETIDGAAVFVLPNPSGRNANFSYEEMLAAFRDLKRHLDSR
jgi:double-stranded uracil-DNA glycosylase